jgi:DNA-binding XRE family transcriptional regulator
MAYSFVVTNLTVRVSLIAVNHKITLSVIPLAVKALFAYTKDMITNAQIRAARALIEWKQTDLAKAAGLSEMSVKNIERGDTDPRVSTLTAIRSALEAAGVVFLDSGSVATGPGVALKG